MLQQYPPTCTSRPVVSNSTDKSMCMCVFCLSSVFHSGDNSGNEKAAALEKKVFSLQEELTELHRRKGDVSTVLPPCTTSYKYSSSPFNKSPDILDNT